MADTNTVGNTVPNKVYKKKDKYNGFTVPNKTDPLRACNHMYEMIKEAAPDLLNREDVKKAYNDFVAMCRTYDRLESWIPSKSYKYRQNIKLDNKYAHEYYVFKGLNFRWPNLYNIMNNPVTKEDIINDTNKILNSYIVLYDLIKRDVVPYMERKEWERTKDKDIEEINNQIARCEESIKAYEKYIADTRERICTKKLYN